MSHGVVNANRLAILSMMRNYYCFIFFHKGFFGGYMKLVCNVLLLTVLAFGVVVAQRNFQQLTKTDKISFISQPPLMGMVGVTFNYTAKAVSNDSTAKIRYFPYQSTIAFIFPNNQFTVDSVTGLLTFIPKTKGWYTLGVMARSTKGGVAYQIFYVTITGGNGIVQGKVTDTVDRGIDDAIIELYNVGSQTSTNIFGSQDYGSFSFWTVTDSSGNYRISGIDPGKYKILAISPSRLYDSQWYEGKSNPTDAIVKEIKDSIVYLINFKLRGGAAVQPKVSVSGSVKDTSNHPIKKAEVIFVNSNYALNANDSIDDFRKYFDINASKIDCRLDAVSQQVIHIIDSSNGTFNANIPPGSYIVFAKADGYVTEFYQEQSSLLLATTIVVKQNTPVTNINFTLAPVSPNVLGSISGSILDTSKDVGVPSRVIVSKDIWTSSIASKVPRMYVVDTDSLGAYNVGQLPSGNYYVLALPLGSYAPAYYTTDTVSNRWKKASLIAVNGTVSGINIYVNKFVVSASGYAGVSGKVITKVNSSTAASIALPGAFVYALINNQVAGYSITDNTGAFSINGLAPGSYSITVDNLGSTEPTASTALVKYTSAGSPVGVTVNFSLNSATSVETNLSAQPEGFTLSQNYPNPFNPSTTINYAIQRSGMVTLKIYNIVGQEIQSLVNEYQAAGNYQVTVNAQNLSSGVYFYKLQNNSTILMRKMILLR